MVQNTRKKKALAVIGIYDERFLQVATLPLSLRSNIIDDCLVRLGCTALCLLLKCASYKHSYSLTHTVTSIENNGRL